MSLVNHEASPLSELISGADTSEQVPLIDPPRQRWERDDIVVVFDDSLTELGPEIEEMIQEAFRTWQNAGAALPNVTFSSTKGALASLRPDGQSAVLVAPIEFEGHESDLAITIGFSNPNTGEVSEADIVINSRHLFSAVQRSQAKKSGALASAQAAPSDQESCTGSLDARACNESYDLQNVLTHEVGHFFGLGENYDDTRATMFSCTSACEIHKRDLEPVDVDSITQLYTAAPERIPEGCLGVQIGRPRLHERTNQLGYWTALLLLTWSRRRAKRQAERRDKSA